jgi:hypothetical protein
LHGEADGGIFGRLIFLSAAEIQARFFSGNQARDVGAMFD